MIQSPSDLVAIADTLRVPAYVVAIPAGSLLLHRLVVGLLQGLRPSIGSSSNGQGEWRGKVLALVERQEVLSERIVGSQESIGAAITGLLRVSGELRELLTEMNKRLQEHDERAREAIERLAPQREGA